MNYRLSFTRGIFAGVIHHKLLFPYAPPLSERDPEEARTVARLISGLRRLKEELIDSEQIDEAETIPEPVVRALASLGIMGLTIPRDYGGLGLTSTGYSTVFSALSAVDASLAVLVGVHCGLGSKAIVLYGTAEQKARYLPLLARGDMLAAFALTEPETGSDAQHITTRAELSEDGAKWILDGRKIWIGNGHRAGVIVTFARAPMTQPRADRGNGDDGSRLTAFIVRPDMPGYRVLGTVRKLGIRGSTQAELAFEHLEVPADHVLGAVGKGFTVAVNVLNGGRLSLAAGCTAGSKLIFDYMARYAEERVQFGRPIAGFEITQRKLSTFASEIYAADAMLGALSWMVDRNENDFSLETACAKVFASELLWRAADEMVQVAGGRGFVKPYPYERMLRDARINRIFEGTNEVLRLFIALNGIQGPAQRLTEVGSALRRPMRSLGLLTGYAVERLREALGAPANLEAALHQRLDVHKRYFEKHVAELDVATSRAIARHRTAIVERQLVLERLANMAIELFATASVLARTQRLIEDRGIDECGHELELCDLFCVDAGRRFRANRQIVEDAHDDLRRSIAASVRERGTYGVADPMLDDLRSPAKRDL